MRLEPLDSDGPLRLESLRAGSAEVLASSMSDDSDAPGPRQLGCLPRRPEAKALSDLAFKVALLSEPGAHVAGPGRGRARRRARRPGPPEAAS